MNTIKRYLGVLWIILGIAAGYYLIVSQAIPKFESPKPEDKIPALIYAFILTPIISIGLCIFGYYALLGEYDLLEDEVHHKHFPEE
jgi:small-conductance mechanosensitive channel